MVQRVLPGQEGCRRGGGRPGARAAHRPMASDSEFAGERECPGQSGQRRKVRWLLPLAVLLSHINVSGRNATTDEISGPGQGPALGSGEGQGIGLLPGTDRQTGLWNRASGQQGPRPSSPMVHSEQEPCGGPEKVFLTKHFHLGLQYVTPGEGQAV